jgi:surfeit locus 1 family protein
LIPTVAAILGIALTAWLGNWQLNRAAEKLRLQQRMDRGSDHGAIHLGRDPLSAADIVYQRVEATGEFIREDTIYVDNRTREGVPGYELVTPLRIDGGGPSVLVNRGWIAAGGERSRLPEVRTPAGRVKVEGTALPGDPRVFELSKQVPSGSVWQNVTVERFRKAFGLQLQPIIMRAQNDLGDGLLRDWPRPDAGIDRHRAYAFQWFALAIAILIIYVVSTVKRRTAAAR